MSCPESGQFDAAPPPPGFSTPTKAIRNDGACHVNPDAERMETESDADVDKEFDESTGKKRRSAGPIVYRFVEEWTNGPQAKLEPKEIEYQILHQDEELYACERLEKDSRTPTK